MGTREELGKELKDILGCNRVYFQRPRNTQLTYPAIVYSKENIRQQYADDKRYLAYPMYNIVVMDTDPDSEIADAILEHFPYCRFNRRYLEDSIYHDVLVLYF